MSGKKLFVQVVGLERLIPVDSAGKFQINDLPAGLFSMRVITVDGCADMLVGSGRIICRLRHNGAGNHVADGFSQKSWFSIRLPAGRMFRETPIISRYLSV